MSQSLSLLTQGLEERGLVRAIQSGDAERVDTMIERLQNVNFFYENKTPLHYAVNAGHLEIVRRLVSAGADYNLDNLASAIDLASSIKQSDENILQYLSDHKAHTKLNPPTCTQAFLVNEGRSIQIKFTPPVQNRSDLRTDKIKAFTIITEPHHIKFRTGIPSLRISASDLSANTEYAFRVSARYVNGKITEFSTPSNAVLTPRAPLIFLEDVKQNRKILGDGAFGDVFGGTWRDLNIAIKRVRGPIEEVQVAFKEEVQVWLKLNHPAVLPLLGICETSLSMVMPLCERGSLTRLIKSTKLTWEQRYIIAEQIAQGMEYLHSNKILHHDLKGENVLVTVDYRVRISDFGLSKVKHTVISSEAKKMKGTLAYMAPEVFEGKGTSYPVDVYSYAMVLYELTAGTVPFKGLTPFEIVGKLTVGKRPAIPDNVGAKPGFIHLMRQCWTQDPGQRPSFSQILEYFNFQDGQPEPWSRPLPFQHLDSDTTIQEQSVFFGPGSNVRFSTIREQKTIDIPSLADESFYAERAANNGIRYDKFRDLWEIMEEFRACGTTSHDGLVQKIGDRFFDEVTGALEKQKHARQLVKDIFGELLEIDTQRSVITSRDTSEVGGGSTVDTISLSMASRAASIPTPASISDVGSMADSLTDLSYIQDVARPRVVSVNRRKRKTKSEPPKETTNTSSGLTWMEAFILEEKDYSVDEFDTAQLAALNDFKSAPSSPRGSFSDEEQSHRFYQRRRTNSTDSTLDPGPNYLDHDEMPFQTGRPHLTAENSVDNRLRIIGLDAIRNTSPSAPPPAPATMPRQRDASQLRRAETAPLHKIGTKGSSVPSPKNGVLHRRATPTFAKRKNSWFNPNSQHSPHPHSPHSPHPHSPHTPHTPHVPHSPRSPHNRTGSSNPSAPRTSTASIHASNPLPRRTSRLPSPTHVQLPTTPHKPRSSRASSRTPTGSPRPEQSQFQPYLVVDETPSPKMQPRLSKNRRQSSLTSPKEYKIHTKFVGKPQTIMQAICKRYARMPYKTLPKAILRALVNKNSPSVVLAWFGKQWQGRLFVLYNDALLWYKSEQDMSPTGVLPLCCVRSISSSFRNQLEIVVSNGERTIEVKFGNEKQKAVWGETMARLMSIWEDKKAKVLVRDDIPRHFWRNKQ